MARAIEIAQNGAGAVSPNPMVGAVVLGPDGQTWGEGWHGRYGGPHAEVWAVRDAETPRPRRPRGRDARRHARAV